MAELGASRDEQLLYAARTDNEDMLLDVFEHAGDFDINCTDGLGNTPLHLAAAQGSTVVLEHILSHEQCDVDPQNRLDLATPLHLAVAIHDPDLRLHVVESLLEAGADTTIKNKHGDTVLDWLGDKDERVRAAVRRAQAQASMSTDDVAQDDDAGNTESDASSD